MRCSFQIFRFHYKGSTFSSVIKRPWSGWGFEPANYHGVVTLPESQDLTVLTMPLSLLVTVMYGYSKVSTALFLFFFFV